MTARIEENAVFSGTVTVPSGSLSEQPRSFLAQSTLRFPVKLTDLRVWDAVQTDLPGTAASDDLAIITGTWATNPIRIQAGDLKAAGATSRRAYVEIDVPECYVAAQAFTIIIAGYMTTTIADNSCTVDVEVYRRGKDGTLGSDICATSATTINSTTSAEKSFTITATTLTPGDVLDVRITIACNDAATVTAVIPTIAAIDVSCACKG